MKNNTGKSGNILLILLIMIIFLLNSICTTISADEGISISVTNLEDEQIYEIYEKKNFKVSVIDFDKYPEKTPYLTNFTIEFNGEKYYISDQTPNSEIVLSAPEVEDDVTYDIVVYNDTVTESIEFKVKNIIELNIESKSGRIIAEGKMFSVEVTDGSNPIEGVTVYIQSVQDYDKSEGVTDSKGIAILRAPTNREEITVVAEYEESTTSILLTVEMEPTFFEELIGNKYTPYIFAFTILILVILYVNYRQKKSVYARAQEITKQKKIDRYVLSDKYEKSTEDKDKDIYQNKTSSLDRVRSSSNPDSKIEEIRISRPSKKKEVVPIKTDEEKTKDILTKKKNEINKNNQDWFEGKDDIKYEINKLTGEVDEEGLDKWFEGVEGLKEKIDKKEKKDKKKKDEEE